MKIAIASGKGGTGKTTLSIALAQAWNAPIQLLDCDVEEPNSALFLKPEQQSRIPVTLPVPVIDKSRCTGCGKCSRFCQFNALLTLNGKTMLFEELCHSCGGCAQVCPEQAITEEQKPIGQITVGHDEKITLVEGRLDVGRSMAPPVIRAVKKTVDPETPILIDCPPGTSCPMMTAVTGADAVILVTEPTPFGLHDLTLAVETVRRLNIPFGVVINRSDSGDDRVVKYCEEQDIRIFLQIPESRKIAESYSTGKSILTAEPALKKPLLELLRSFA
ncbi:MAG: ATP-binding protein [Kiritimatiellales bacterium]